MKRPSFQFYPADWRKDANLRRCSPAARGVWMDVLCVLHDSDEYGIVRWPLKELASAAGASLAHLKELVDKRVLKGSDRGAAEGLIYTPRSGRKDGPPVTLIPEQDGPLWYSARFVRDEYVRNTRGEATRFTTDTQPDPEPVPRPKAAAQPTERSILRQRVLEKTAGHCYHCEAALGEVWEIDHLMPRAKGGRHTFANLVPSCVACNQDKSDTLPDDWAALKASPTRRVGDGASSASSPSGNTNTSGANAPGAAAPPDDDLGMTSAESRKAAAWRGAKSLLHAHGMPKAQTGAFIGKLASDHPDTYLAVLEAAVLERPAEPDAWMRGACQQRAGTRQPAEPQWRTEQRERTRQAAPGVAAGAPAAQFFIDVEAKPVMPAALPRSVQ